MLFAGVLTSGFSAVVAPVTAAAEEPPAGTFINDTNTFYAYVGAGENLDISFVKAANGAALNAAITARGPGGVVQTCAVTDTAPTGANCTFPNLSGEGIWQIEFAKTGTGTATVTDNYRWAIDVQDGTTDVPGRVWSNRYAMSNGTATDFTLHYVSEQGFLYEAEFSGYIGINSVFAADAAGNTLNGTCTSAYLSYDQSGPNSDEATYDSPITRPFGTCGDPYKIFFDSPDPDLPTTATLPDGSSTWVLPDLKLPDLTGLTFEPTGGTLNRSGTFTVDATNFTGQMVVQLDANGDGDYDDDVDRDLPLSVVDGEGTVTFDGLDGAGNPIPRNVDINARAVIDQAGEIHFVNGDVERRDGFQVTARNGPSEGSTQLFWNDSDLLTQGRACLTPQINGSAGVDSTGGVHGWTCSDNSNNGVNGSWGDVRNIDDWTFQDVNDTVEIVLPGLPALVIDKSSTATAQSRVGDTITYTVKITNNGPGDYTDENPARVDDDLSEILDDATYNGDADATAGTVTYDEPRLTWSGALASGASVTITYTVDLTGAGDQILENVAFQVVCEDGEEDCDPPPPEACENNVDPATGLPCDVVPYELPKLEITKTADKTELPAVGETVTYTVTATNTGEAPFTAERPAVVIDDLTRVLDDATVDPTSIEASTGMPPAYTEPKIKWVGELAVGASVTVTYEVTYTGEGDAQLVNVAFAPPCPADDPDCDTVTPQCDPADENGLDPETGIPCGRVTVPAALLEVEKSASPTDGSVVQAGQEVTYTVTFGNSGTATADVDNWTDDISKVLDDAEVVTAPTSSDPDLTVSEIADGRFTVDGTVPAGESYTITYTVRVLPDGERGDDVLANFVFPDGVTPPETCATDSLLCTNHLVPLIEDTKSADPEDGTEVQPGQEITYTLTFTNSGAGGGVVDRVDDFTGVLDDAELLSGPTATGGDFNLALDPAGKLFIDGRLEADQTVTITYTVRVKAADDMGDAVLANFLLDPDEEPPTECEVGDENCTSHLAPKITDTKSVDPETGTIVQSGQELTYTLTFTNSGKAAGPVNKVDNLTRLLDDADITTTPESSDAALSVSAITDGRFAITGTLGPGATVTVAYTATVKASASLGDALLGNFLLEPGEEPPVECEAVNDDCTQNPVPRIVDSKSVDPESGTTVQPGAELTYTLTFTNTGLGAGAVNKVDDLTHVLDDAVITTDPEASDDALKVSGIAKSRYTITGDLQPGQTVTVTYTVTVNAADDLGDLMLANFLMDPDQPPPPDPECDGGDDCTQNPVTTTPPPNPGPGDPSDPSTPDPGQPGDPDPSDPPNPGPGDPGDPDPNDPGLPNTGAPVVLAPLVAGLILIAGGLGLVALRRRFAAGKGSGIDGQP